MCNSMIPSILHNTPRGLGGTHVEVYSSEEVQKDKSLSESLVQNIAEVRVVEK